MMAKHHRTTQPCGSPPPLLTADARAHIDQWERDKGGRWQEVDLQAARQLGLEEAEVWIRDPRLC